MTKYSRVDFFKSVSAALAALVLLAMPGVGFTGEQASAAEDFAKAEQSVEDVAAQVPASGKVAVENAASAAAVEPTGLENDGVAVAGQHCMLLLAAIGSDMPLVAADGLDMSFVLGGATLRATANQLAEFNAKFARHLAESYRLSKDGKTCAMHAVDSEQMRRQGVGVKHTPRPGLPKVAEAAAFFVATSLPTQNKGVPVQVTNTLQGGAGHWRIVDMSINGRPLADNYRRLRSFAQKHGFGKMLEKMNEVL